MTGSGARPCATDDFTAAFLRGYAPIVGKALNSEQPGYFTMNPLNAEVDTQYWDNSLDMPTFQYKDLLATEGAEYERYCHAVVSPGVAIVQVGTSHPHYNPRPRGLS